MDDYPTNGQHGADAADPAVGDRYAALVEGPAGVPNEALLGKVRGGGFSWGTFFIGPLYWAYRRCYPEAAVLVLLNILVSFLPDSPVWLVLSLATSVVLGVAFPFLYRWRADRLHDRALAQGAAGEREAVAFVRSRGGTSWVGVAVLLTIAVGLASVEVIALNLAASAQAPATVSTF